MAGASASQASSASSIPARSPGVPWPAPAPPPGREAESARRKPARLPPTPRRARTHRPGEHDRRAARAFLHSRCSARHPRAVRSERAARGAWLPPRRVAPMANKKWTKAELLSRPVAHVDIAAFDSRPIIDAYRQMAYSSRTLAQAADIYSRMLADTDCAVI